MAALAFNIVANASVAPIWNLFLWIVLAFTIVHYHVVKFRDFWLTPNFFGVSNFQLYEFACF